MQDKKWPLCQVCGKLVSTQQGQLVIYQEEMFQFEERYREWEKRHPLRENGSQLLTPQDIIELPRLRWHWGHSDCLQDSIMYDISYSQFVSIEKVLGWTLHLMKKEWFRHTNWEDTVLAHYELSIP